MGLWGVSIFRCPSKTPLSMLDHFRSSMEFFYHFHALHSMKDPNTLCQGIERVLTPKQFHKCRKVAASKGSSQPTNPSLECSLANSTSRSQYFRSLSLIVLDDRAHRSAIAFTPCLILWKVPPMARITPQRSEIRLRSKECESVSANNGLICWNFQNYCEPR